MKNNKKSISLFELTQGKNISEQVDYTELSRMLAASDVEDDDSVNDLSKYTTTGSTSNNTSLVTYKPKYGKGNKQGDEGHRDYTGQVVIYKGNEYPVFKIRSIYSNNVDTSITNPNRLIVPNRSDMKYLNVMKTVNPKEPGRQVEGMIFTNELIETVDGSALYLVKNYGVPSNGRDFTYNFIDASNGRTFYGTFPKVNKFGTAQKSKTEYRADRQRKLDDARNEQEYQKLLRKFEREDKGYAQTRISRVINSVMEKEDLVNHLNDMFISTTPGDERYTEMNSNVIHEFLWGVKSPEIKVQYHGIIGARVMNELVEKLHNRILDTKGINIDLANEDDVNSLFDVFGVDADPNDEGDNEQNNDLFYNDTEQLKNTTGSLRRKADRSADYLRRNYARVYPGGKWQHKQRVGSTTEYIRRGGPTPVRHLNPKDIQKGKIHVSSKSDLYIHGDLVNNKYIVDIMFDNDVVFRPQEQNVNATVVGSTLPNGKIEFTIERELTGKYASLNRNNLRLGDSTNELAIEFLTGSKGVITDAVKTLGYKLLEIDPEMVINKLIDIIMPKGEMNESKKINSKGKKIKLNESQVRRLMNTISEEKFDDMISNFKRLSNDAIPVPHDELVIMFNIAKDWCRRRSNDSDCEDIMNLRTKLNF